MKKLSIVTVLGLSITLGAAAHAGYRFDIDQTETLCLPETHLSSTEALQEVTESAIATLKAACEEHPGASGAHSNLKSIEIQDKGACGCGLYPYKYHVTASCYIP